MVGLITNELGDAGQSEMNIDNLPHPHVWSGGEGVLLVVATFTVFVLAICLAHTLWKNRQAIRNAVTTIHPRWITLAARGLIGAAVLVCVGYLGDAANHQAITFGYWITAPIRNGVFTWAAAGAALGALTLLAGRAKI
jgi:hypothetical protein